MASQKNMTIKKVLVIGSGPIVIGQSAEFDYSGTQACASLREEGIEVVLVNSNPATIQTDKNIADRVYIEPIRADYIERIIEAEKPDAILATMGGQTALNIAMELHGKGVLAKYGVKLLGTGIEAIELAEDRGKFAGIMRELHQPIPNSIAANSLEQANEFAKKHSFPLILRPAFTLGGTGGGIARNREDFDKLLELGFSLSPTHQILIEESVLGWAEFEYEVMRDMYDNCITICNMENIDPMGVHTGESVVVAPSQTLTDREHQLFRSAALKIIRRLGIIGGCNIQFALNQKTGQYIVVEVNPRLSRSSALASKATGYPIARVAAKVALGMPLHKIQNAVTKNTPASFEPALDYCVVKIPRWPFDKMPEADRTLGTQMKSTGETMAIGRTYEEALMKAMRSIEKKPAVFKTESELERHIKKPTDLRLEAIFQAIRLGWDIKKISRMSGIHMWFLDRVEYIVSLEKRLASEKLSPELLRIAKQAGFSDDLIGKFVKKTGLEIRQERKRLGIMPVYKMVDTCAAEFDAATPYYYSTYEAENESVGSGNRAGQGQVLETAKPPAAKNGKGKVIVLGSGPIRIGQGIEFDYCCCHASFALRKMGFESIMVNNNPETMSTDFDTSDKLYFEPLALEDVLNIVDNEKPFGVIVQFGGQTSINLAEGLEHAGVKLLGTQMKGIDIAEDREKFRQLLQRLGIKQPANRTATSVEEAVNAAAEISYPVVIRPSYVIAGRGMAIIYAEGQLRQYVGESIDVSENKPVLIDKYIENAIECEIDGISDKSGLFIGGIMEHIERAGVHSGDASCTVPPIKLKPEIQKEIISHSEKIALALENIGCINIQYVVKDDVIYVLEANPRGSRTIPFLSKAIGMPLAQLATRVIMGESLSSLGLSGIPDTGHYSVKSVVFPFLKLPGADLILGPEMKSTGESMGIENTFSAAFYKALLGANLKIPLSGSVAISLKQEDQERGAKLAEKFKEAGFEVYATSGTAKHMPFAHVMNKISQGAPHIVSLAREKKLDLVVNTPRAGKNSATDGYKIRRAAIESNIPCITSIEAAERLVDAILQMQKGRPKVRELTEYTES
ncbi:MAG: carbamoyl-phosphate synthase large subunit [Candidatus Micrarchaeia archaeon]